MNKRSFTPHVIEAISRALRVTGHFSTEKDLQLAVYNEFRSNGLCERECRVEFSPASVPPPTPPLPFEPMDVCEERGCRKLDLLATLQAELVAIELKFSRDSRWRGSCRGIPLPTAARSDVIPYGFLKDIHRMERLKHAIVGGRCVVPPYRVCALISNEPFDTDGKTVHERMRLYPRTLPARHLVQFNETTESGKTTSLNTLWRYYPPFHLARSYELRWNPVDTADVVPADGETRQYPPFQVLAVDVSFAG